MGRVRTEYDIATTDPLTALTVIPKGTPLYVKGESSQKDTYDFTINYVILGSSISKSVRFAGALNGSAVQVHQWFPMPGSGSNMTDPYYNITPGADVTLRVYYIEQ